MKPGRAMMALAITLSLLVGCSAFPSSGPVQTVGDIDRDERSGGIRMAGRPPVAGASPESILEDFLAAAESSADDYSVARQYLTFSAASSWDPAAGIAIYDPSKFTRNLSADGAAVIQAGLVGRADDKRVFTSVRDEIYDHDFKMVQIDGEWRISDPGDGLLM